MPAIEFDTTVIEVDVTKIIELRRKVLRPGLPLEKALFPEDRISSTKHFGLFWDSDVASMKEPLCCLTFIRKEYLGTPALQLRGMAVEEKYRGKGLGRKLLFDAEGMVSVASGIRHILFWCDARVSSVSFYEKAGWQIASDRFDIPGIGLHQKMVKRL